MSETYARHIVYRAWHGTTFRPHASFDTLVEAVRYVDEEGDPSYDYKVIDLEHIDMGDMLIHPDCAELIARIRRAS